MIIQLHTDTIENIEIHMTSHEFFKLKVGDKVKDDTGEEYTLIQRYFCEEEQMLDLTFTLTEIAVACDECHTIGRKDRMSGSPQHGYQCYNCYYKDYPPIDQPVYDEWGIQRN